MWVPLVWIYVCSSENPRVEYDQYYLVRKQIESTFVTFNLIQAPICVHSMLHKNKQSIVLKWII